MRELIIKIAERLAHMNNDDMTTAERQIADLLVKHDYCGWDDDGELVMWQASPHVKKPRK